MWTNNSFESSTYYLSKGKNKMICHWRNTNSDALLTCMGLTPIYTEAEVSDYAKRGGPGGPANWAYFYAVSCLRINRLIRPNIPEGPCGQTKGVPTGAQKTFAYIGLAGTQDPEPISNAIIEGVAKIGAFFSNLFSGAPSAQELQTQCDIVNSYNAFADAMEQALASGKITLSDAIAQLGVVHGQLTALGAQVEGGQDSAPFGLGVALNALKYYNEEVIYPAHVMSSTGVTGIINKTGQPISNFLSVITGGTIKVSATIALILVVILIMLGVSHVKVRTT